MVSKIKNHDLTSSTWHKQCAILKNVLQIKTFRSLMVIKSSLTAEGLILTFATDFRAVSGSLCAADPDFPADDEYPELCTVRHSLQRA